MKLKNKSILFTILLTLALNGCGVYSFTGISIDYSQVKTISIATFFNDSGGGPPNLSQQFTEAIKDYFQQNSELLLVNYDGDLQLEGAITGYRLRPVNSTAGGNTVSTASGNSLQRLEIVVKASFIHTKDDTQSYEKTFTFFSDYDPASTSLTAAEPELIDTIFEQIIFDIFNASVANW